MALKDLVLGKAKDPLDPKAFEHLSLVAFLAWVGLGADGLSSSCYGPEEIFVTLGPNAALAPILIAAVALTVAILSAGYSFTIEAFPGGGGGYLVTTQTLGRHAGLLCGTALIVDYALTVAISIASGVDALFSVLPRDWQEHKLAAVTGAVAALTILNLRGVKESIKVLMPIFLGFLATHAVAIVMILAAHGGETGTQIQGSIDHAGVIVQGQGWMGLVLILMGAYTVGAGTYTGIEAVSNSVPLLREPRVATAKRTMLYMAISLALTSGGLLLGYMLYKVQHADGRTLNAVLLTSVAGTGGFGKWFVPLTLLTEGALLFVAAQAGFVAGPRMMAAMAVDSWIPRRFRHLNDRLVVSNGILLVGGGAIAAVWLTDGKVKALVVIYAFSVFVTFVLSQLGMCVHYLRHREARWIRRLAVNGAAFVLSAVVVGFMIYLRGNEGVRAAGGVIIGLMLLCLWIRRYYDRSGRLIAHLETVKAQVESDPTRKPTPPKDPGATTAVVLVRGFNGAGIHTLLTIMRLFPDYFRNLVFVSVGDIDFDRFKGVRELDGLRDSVRGDLEKYVELTRRWGFHAEYRMSLGVDVADELLEICPAVAREFPRALFFSGQLVFHEPTFVTRLMHEQTAGEIQRRLQFQGLAMIILPIRVGAESK